MDDEIKWLRKMEVIPLPKPKVTIPTKRGRPVGTLGEPKIRHTVYLNSYADELLRELYTIYIMTRQKKTKSAIVQRAIRILHDREFRKIKRHKRK